MRLVFLNIVTYTDDEQQIQKLMKEGYVQEELEPAEPIEPAEVVEPAEAVEPAPKKRRTKKVTADE